MAKFDTRRDKILLAVDYTLLFFLTVFMLYPFWEQLVLSVSPRAEALRSGLHLFTLNPTLVAYRKVLSSPEILQGFFNSVIRVISGTSISIFFTALTAYPLSKKYFPLNKLFTVLILFTMMFNGGLIPNYLLIKSLGLLNTRWVLILPSAVTAWNLIIMRNFLKSIPDSLEESARIDGASDFMIWWRIVLPLSKPVLATIALWMAVHHWNAYFDALIYITDRSKIVIQVILRRILLEDQMDFVSGGMMVEVIGEKRPTGEVIKAAIIMVSTLPIIMVYPFLQKHFVKGIMLGAVKG